MKETLQILSEQAPATRGMRVFSSQLQQKLAVMNQAARTLRAMGYCLARQEPLPRRGIHPLIYIKRGAQPSIAPLLDRATRRGWRYQNGCMQGMAEFMGVMVVWEQA